MVVLFDTCWYYDTTKVSLVVGSGVSIYGPDMVQHFSVCFQYVVGFFGFVALQPCGDFSLTSYQSVYEYWICTSTGGILYSPI